MNAEMNERNDKILVENPMSDATANEQRREESAADVLAQNSNAGNNSDVQKQKDKDNFLKEIKRDPNAFPASTIQEKINELFDGKYDALKDVFNDAQIKAIKNFQSKTIANVEYRKPDNNTLEVYFWGLKGSGKTCAIASIIGCLYRAGRLILPNKCPGEVYINSLLNMIFDPQLKDAPRQLPGGTNERTLPIMTFRFKDSEDEKKEHSVTIIDVAGENFGNIYNARTETSIVNKIKNILQNIKSIFGKGNEQNDNQQARQNNDIYKNLENCLNNKNNNKIHFFIIENGQDRQFDRNTTYCQVLGRLIAFFDDRKIFSEVSVGMYVLFTKCDAREDRQKVITQYFDNAVHAENLKNNIMSIANKTKCKYQPIAFSIGEVFAQDLCVFNFADAEKLVKIIEENTKGRKNTFLNRIINLFKNN